ncbi:MAG: hypothetical protein A2Z11_04620 [Candidatus Woykebacteria bacterium RBG_16_43_9]|uniref:Phosphoglycerate mutase n=1 Tax=Candidatus Woykebacteria bacterium RBG_16_43_9 TaxID=1802596 RepID=A0A1G1WD76_9BACT|nr:MAG: hypothetical protein A2Z11_04620 [Candidatus Woykebacteria bacterium RBG_16_43_9]
MSTIIHYVRHSSYDNPDRIVPGKIPGYRLNDEGKKKAKRVGEFLKESGAQFIYTSPLERAYQTAEIIGKYLPKAKIIHTLDLTEVDSIHWQAYKLEELFTNNYYEAFVNNPAAREVPENLTQLAERMEKFTFFLCERHRGERVICVSHEFPIAALRLSMEDKSLTLLKSYNVSMASITSFEFDENCKLLKSTYKEIS